MNADHENQPSVRCSETLNSQPRLSVFEDFVQRTLSILNGVWSKLNYIRELRDADGKYRHWGLECVHGSEATDKTIADVHTELYLQLLRTPLPDLLEHLELSAEDADCSSRELIEQLYRERRRITPACLRGGAPQHLRSVLLITDLLSKHRRD